MNISSLKLSTFTVFLTVLFLAACGGEGTTNNATEDTPEEEATATEAAPSVMGDWKLVGFETNGSTDKFKECDAQTIWTFTDENAEPLGDGTVTKKIVATAPADCKFFGFESSWAMTPQDQLFISSTRVGGMGGASNAGLFNIEELTEQTMVLKAFNNIYTFER